jgi:hypothetical protein
MVAGPGMAFYRGTKWPRHLAILSKSSNGLSGMRRGGLPDASSRVKGMFVAVPQIERN